MPLAELLGGLGAGGELLWGLGVGLFVFCSSWLAYHYISPHAPCKSSIYYGRNGVTLGVIGAVLIAVRHLIGPTGTLDIGLALGLFLVFLALLCPSFAAIGWLWGMFTGNKIITPGSAFLAVTG